MTWHDDYDRWRQLFDEGVEELMRERQRTFVHSTVLVRIEPTLGRDVPPGPLDLLPVLSGSAAYTVSAAIERSMAENGEAAISVIQVGDTILVDDVLDRLHAAGCWVEETADRITIHMPNSVEIPGVFNLADAFPPKLPAERLRREPDYLRHDPTKQHRRRRKRR